MTSRPKKDINYLLKITGHAKDELNFGMDPESRVRDFLWTKSGEAKQAAKEKLLDYLQTPPNRLTNESDKEYLIRFAERDACTEKYEWLLHYIK